MSKATLNKERKAYCQDIHTLTGGSLDVAAVFYLTNLLEFTSCLPTKEKNPCIFYFKARSRKMVTSCSEWKSRDAKS